jgi:hypothetical protein
VLVDPADELADTLGAIEDWLGWAEAESPEEEHTLRAGASAVGELAAVVRGAARRAPALFAPDGRVELAPLLVVSCDLGGVVSRFRRAMAIPGGTEESEGARRLLDLLERAGVFAATEGCRVLLGVARPGAGRVVLAEAEQRAYVRCVVAILASPFDRFLALGPGFPGCRDVEPVEARGLGG